MGHVYHATKFMLSGGGWATCIMLQSSNFLKGHGPCVLTRRCSCTISKRWSCTISKHQSCPPNSTQAGKHMGKNRLFSHSKNLIIFFDQLKLFQSHQQTLSLFLPYHELDRFHKYTLALSEIDNAKKTCDPSTY